MYRFMIVDDDRFVRERILSLIAMDDMNLELCCQAEDGIQALELFELYHPQIVIMDIEIPFLNGIEVAKKMLEDTPDVKIIIITGYGTVEFAQSALRSGFVDFLLKPISPKELNHVLQKTIEEIHREAKQALEQQRMERLLEHGMPLIRSRYFLSLLQVLPQDLTDDDCNQYLLDFGIVPPINCVCVSIIVPNYEGLSLNEQVSMQSVLENTLSKSIETCGIGTLMLYDSLQRIILVCYSQQNFPDHKLERCLSMVRDKLRYLHQFDFRASIGNIVPNFRYIHDSYENASQSLGYWSVLGNNSIVNSNTIQRIEAPVPIIEMPRYSDIIELLMAEDVERLSKISKDYVNRLTYNTHNSIHYVRQKAVELLALINTCAQQLGVETDYGMNGSTPIYTEILSAETSFDVQRIILDTIQNLTNGIQSKRQDNRSRALRSAKKHIYQNYQDPNLSLASVAEIVNLSPNYLAQLFRTLENCSFGDYLNRIRIEQAQKLLLNSHLHVYEVAECVGFLNTKYFFQVFKKITGMRPKEFSNTATK